MSIRPLALVLATLALALSGCASRQLLPPLPQAADGSLKESYYQIRTTAHDGETLSLTVYQPKLAPGQTAPLVLHTHGFGAWRMKRPWLDLYGSIMPTGEAAQRAWHNGYWVISYDQRGHGDSGGHIRITDPELEVRDVSTLIDWAEKNLPQLARNENGARVGMVGESYGGGLQYVASAKDKRLQALVPVTTWYDLDTALAPNGVPKSNWIDVLNFVGDWFNWNEFDPVLKQAYKDSNKGFVSSDTYRFLNQHRAKWFCDNGQPPQADALIFQGFRDVLFPFNQGLGAQDCLRSAGRDVRLIGIDEGHLQPLIQHSPGLHMPIWYMAATVQCPGRTVKVQEMISAWFDAKLKDATGGLAGIPVFCVNGSPVESVAALQAATEYKLPELSLRAGGRHEWLLQPADHVRNWFSSSTLPADWQKPEKGGVRPLLLPLSVIARDSWLTGVPRLKLDIKPVAGDGKPVLFVSLAAWRPGSGSYRLLNEQTMPFSPEAQRHRAEAFAGAGVPLPDESGGVELPAVNEPLKAGEVLGLVFSSRSPYFGSSSRGEVEAEVGGSVLLPALVPAGKLAGD